MLPDSDIKTNTIVPRYKQVVKATIDLILRKKSLYVPLIKRWGERQPILF